MLPGLECRLAVRPTTRQEQAQVSGKEMQSDKVMSSTATVTAMVTVKMFMVIMIRWTPSSVTWPL